MTTLSELLADESIALNTRAKDWRDALRQAGDLLGAAGVAEPAYTDAMIAGLEEHGPYIVISPGFAFAHARPSAAVHRTGIAWLSLAEPVEFGHAKNDPVSLVVALAATDDQAHTTAMAQLAKLLGNS